MVTLYEPTVLCKGMKGREKLKGRRWQLLRAVLVNFHPERQNVVTRAASLWRKLRTCNWVSCACLGAQLCLAVCDPLDCAHQAPLSVWFFRQEYWSRLLFPSPRDLPDLGLNPCFLYLLHCRQFLYSLSHREALTLYHIPS